MQMSASTFPQGSGSGTGGELDVMRRSQVSDGIISGQSQISRQLEQIRHVTDENEGLKKEISAVSGTHYDYVKADKLATLQGDLDALERRYQFEKMRKNDLTKRYQLARIDLLHSRKMKGGVYVEKEQAEAVQRQVDILENRLDQALGKFNDALSYNKELRDQIDIIREERRVFQRVHKKMEDDLRAKKKLMAERIEQSNRDMDERDEYLRQAAQLEQQIAQQQAAHSEQLHALDMAMLEIKTMREDQTNLQLELEAREFEFEGQLADMQAEQSNNNHNMTGTGNQSSFGSPAANPNNAASTANAALGDPLSDGDDSTRQTANVLRLEDEPGTITDVVAQIKDATKAADLDAVSQEYDRLGDKNFSLYKYINEMTASKEALRDEIRDLKLLLNEETESETEQRRIIKDLEGQLALTEAKLEKLQANTDQLREAVALTAAATEDVYTHVGCAGSGYGSAPTDTTCGEANVLLFLGDIEERATHILCAYQRHHQRTIRRLEAAQQHQQHQQHQQLKHANQHSVDEDDENALTANTTDSPRGDLPPNLSADELEGMEVTPVLSPAPLTAHNAVTAKRLVRLTELPSASLANNSNNAGNTGSGAAAAAGNAEGAGNALLNELEDGQVVSHDELRRQMELRLVSRREREERAQQRKKKDLAVSQPTPRRAK